jgi:hypothetical protein
MTGEKITGADKNLTDVDRNCSIYYKNLPSGTFQNVCRLMEERGGGRRLLDGLFFPNVTCSLLFRPYFITTCFPFIVCAIFMYNLPDFKIIAGPATLPSPPPPILRLCVSLFLHYDIFTTELGITK